MTSEMPSGDAERVQQLAAMSDLAWVLLERCATHDDGYRKVYFRSPTDTDHGYVLSQKQTQSGGWASGLWLSETKPGAAAQYCLNPNADEHEPWRPYSMTGIDREIFDRAANALRLYGGREVHRLASALLAPLTPIDNTFDRRLQLRILAFRHDGILIRLRDFGDSEVNAASAFLFELGHDRRYGLPSGPQEHLPLALAKHARTVHSVRGVRHQ